MTDQHTNAVVPDASNKYLVALLRITLVEKGWSLQRLIDCMRWRDPEWLAGVTDLALELGLITVNPKIKPTAKPRKSAEVFILPVPLRSPELIPPEPVHTKQREPGNRREPASWIMEGERDDER
jgi:hypothetical protein